jgi:hypothetical protein
MTIERAIVKGTLADTIEIRNMLTCEVIESGGDTSAILWEAYMSSWFDALENLLGSLVHYYQYEVEYWSDPDWLPKDAVDLDIDGTDIADSLPFQAALVLVGKAVGKRAMGRKFIAGLTEGTQAAGVLTVTAAAHAAALLVAYITPFEGLGGGTITPGILTKAGTFAPFVSGLVSSVLGSMRRRKPGVGS